MPGSRLRQGIVEVRLRLSTLLGLDDLAGHAPTWGALGADQARALALARPGGEWRAVLCHPDGRLLAVALLRRRPDHAPRHRRDGRDARAVVELAVTVDELAALVPDEHGPFAAMLREAQDALATAPDPADPRHPASSRADAARRHPGAELDRYLRVRDRHCIGPACHHTAATAQIDHTRDWITGGPTTAPNLGVPCTRHHDAKTDRRWSLSQPSPGHFRWRSPAGFTFDVRPRPVIRPVPAPLRARTTSWPVPPVVGEDEETDDSTVAPIPTPRPRRPTTREVLTGRAPPAADDAGPEPPF